MNIFKTFRNTLRHNRLLLLFNIVGLSIAIAVSYVLFVQVEYEFNYNSEIKDSDRIYRVEFKNSGPHEGFTARLAKSFIRLIVTGNKTVEAYHYGHIKSRPVDHAFEKFPDESLQLSGMELTQGSIDVFGVELIEGDFEPVLNRSAMAFSRSVAERYGLQIGDRVCWGGTYKKAVSLVVGAIFEDFPENSDLNGLQAFYGPYYDQMAGNNWSDWNDPLFVKLYSKDDVEAFYDHVFTQIRLLADTDRFELIDTIDDLKQLMRIIPFDEIYFVSDPVTGEVGNRIHAYTMLTIAVVMLLVAFVNFFNSFVALIPQRIRSVNLQKILGAHNWQLRSGVFSEVIIIVALSVLLAWLFVELFARSSFNDLFSASMFVGDNVSVAVAVCGVTLLVTSVVSVYPIWYLTSFSPAFVLKGSFGATAAGKFLRNMLIGVQFVLSFVFIIVTMFVYLQYRFMTNYDMGFDRENVLMANLYQVDGDLASYSRLEDVRSALMANAAVKDVTFAFETVVSIDKEGMSWGRDVVNDTREEGINFKVLPVYWNFLDVMGMKITEGRGFDEKDMLAGNVYIFNRTAKEKYNINLGDMLFGVKGHCPIVGFCNDFHFRPLKHSLYPYAFFILPSSETRLGGLPWVYIKLVDGSDVAAMRDFVRKELSAFNPKVSESSINVILLDERIAMSYKKEHDFFVLISLFSVIMLIVSLLGVFAMVFLEVQYRNREIAIRRVNGAQVSNILRLFNVRFIGIIMICFVIAVPVALLFVMGWMEQFAYKMPLHWWVFVIAFAIVALLTVSIVVASAWRTVNRNPMDVLR